AGLGRRRAFLWWLRHCTVWQAITHPAAQRRLTNSQRPRGLRDRVALPQHQIDRIFLKLLREFPSSHLTPLCLVISLPFEVSRFIRPLQHPLFFAAAKKDNQRKRLQPSVPVSGALRHKPLSRRTTCARPCSTPVAQTD